MRDGHGHQTAGKEVEEDRRQDGERSSKISWVPNEQELFKIE